jgi:hypothetical protein
MKSGSHRNQGMPLREFHYRINESKHTHQNDVDTQLRNLSERPSLGDNVLLHCCTAHCGLPQRSEVA